MKSVLVALLLLLTFNPVCLAEEESDRSSLFALDAESDDEYSKFKFANERRRTLNGDIDAKRQLLVEKGNERSSLPSKEELETYIDQSKAMLNDSSNESKRAEDAVKAAADFLATARAAAEKKPDDTDTLLRLDDARYNYDFAVSNRDGTVRNIAQAKQNLEGDERGLKKRAELDTVIEKLKMEQSVLARELLEIENSIAELLNRDNLRNNFRLQISIAFVCLVAVVIIGFFTIAFKKDELAQDIFSGEKGIQFVTLFLIIISIILFGIMGTLGSRELSALLGALSGYILGKTTTRVDAPPPAKVP